MAAVDAPSPCSAMTSAAANRIALRRSMIRDPERAEATGRIAFEAVWRVLT